MPVEIIVDQWNPGVKRNRAGNFLLWTEELPAGATRKVPGRTGMMYEEEDWIDEELTAHRDPDE